MSDPVFIEIETAIRPVSCITVQAGQKSLHRITISFSTSQINQQFITGHTRILGCNLTSARDKFELITPGFDAVGARAFFGAKGQTASRALYVMAINYSFQFEVTQSSVSFSGNHDGYPSYNIAVNGKVVYDYVQGHIGQLAGDSDVQVERRDFRI